MIDEAENRSINKAFSPLVIWFLAFNFSSIINFVYAIYLLYSNNSWKYFIGGSEEFIHFYKNNDGSKATHESIHLNTIRAFCMAACWMAHIHL